MHRKPTRQLSLEESALLNGGETVATLPVDLEGLLCHGLTKRELFAAMVLAGFAAKEGRGGGASYATSAVLHADELLLALERVQP